MNRLAEQVKRSRKGKEIVKKLKKAKTPREINRASKLVKEYYGI